MSDPFRSCLLSGGASRRMGRDKALLPHPAGGTWLEGTLALLLELGQPLTLISRHGTHQLAAEALMAQRAAGGRSTPPLAVFREPPPWEGPLRALARLMGRHPGERLLLCPVDLPHLDAPTLEALIGAAAGDPDRERIHLAHDGQRLQPLLGLVPATPARRLRLEAALGAGERGMQRWLAGEDWVAVPLPPGPLRNANRPEDLDPSVFLPAAPGS
ncbi:MAG: molybdenum cofactor guanylyltransferase [Cyanobacteriota bacterium]|nr:molybdenum cofactor guanylyltransferase [Cyanobacteriota bacterium]